MLITAHQFNNEPQRILLAAVEEKDVPGPTRVGATVEIPTKNNPIIVAIYGQICIAAKS
jgi:general transcription factor 3C polypeptide 3 (transcription factor C subunit 4)